MIGSLNCLVMSDRMLWLDRRQSARLSISGGCFGCEDIFLEEALTDELFHVTSKAPIMDSLVLPIVMVREVLFYFEK